MTNKGRILLADDEETFLESTKELLCKEGFQCTRATNATEVLEILDQSEFDLLISDINMPGNRELQLIERLSEVASGMPIILVTGYPTLDTAITAVRLPVIGYLIKPIDYDELLRMIRSAIHCAQINRAMESTRQRMAASTSDLTILRETTNALGQPRATTNMEAYFQITQENLLHTFQDLVQITSALSGKSPERNVCQLMNCPRLEKYRETLQEAVHVLEETKTAFKSKRIEILRKRITDTLDDEVTGHSSGSLDA